MPPSDKTSITALSLHPRVAIHQVIRHRGRQSGGNSRFVAIGVKANYLICLQGWVAEWLKAPVLKCACYCFSSTWPFRLVPRNP